MRGTGRIGDSRPKFSVSGELNLNATILRHPMAVYRGQSASVENRSRTGGRALLAMAAAATTCRKRSERANPHHRN